jgi:HSP20 family protein
MSMDLTRRQPTSGATRLPDLMNRLFQESFVMPSVFEGAVGQGLRSRILETNDSYIVQAALPGVDADKVDIQISGQAMTLKGAYSVPTPEGARVLWGGSMNGDFAESFTLPGEVDPGKADARYDNGILTITVPKAEHVKPKSIKVQTTR